MCSLQFFSSHNCGCAILSSKFVITAAHCVWGRFPKQLRILVGTNNLKGNGDYYSVTRIIEHEKFIMFAHAYDIAVVEVDGPISFNDKVQPIKYSTREPTHGSLAQLTGWGRIRIGGPLPDQLQVINMPVVSTVACREILGSDVHDSHICAFAEDGRGACYADSGSPLVFDNEIIGIVSFGRPCARGYPDAFAKISYLAGWIKSTTGLQA
ncbi:chymotrypsin-1-like [Bradysia coprophila]|uniref:chymotrypsin-1-like n=1 Tax=Bradysia coprophila TaxID=38358 RepID=UPI00187DCC7E|nr:chymotrypsin-1-like [Bradysia coprophila]